MKRRTPEMVVNELRRRDEEGLSLKSGDNRGDWLYAAATNRFGSWRAAVEAAGFDYEEIRTKPMTVEEVCDQLHALAEGGDPLRVKDHGKLSRSALELFGSWEKAITAAGLEVPDRRKWTPEKVLGMLKQDIEEGLPMGANAMRRRNENLYAAARRQFGTWKAAVAAARSAVDAESG